jgi:ribosomal protein L36
VTKAKWSEPCAQAQNKQSTQTTCSVCRRRGPTKVISANAKHAARQCFRHIVLLFLILLLLLSVVLCVCFFVVLFVFVVNIWGRMDGTDTPVWNYTGGGSHPPKHLEQTWLRKETHIQTNLSSRGLPTRGIPYMLRRAPASPSGMFSCLFVLCLFLGRAMFIEACPT